MGCTLNPINHARTYSCPHCGAIFTTTTPEAQRKLGLHRLVHVEVRQRPIRLTQAVLAGTRVGRRMVAD
jgi:hypothetical protein